MITQEKAEDALGRLNQTRDQLLSEIRKGIIGQDEVIEELLVTLLARGHCLLTGIPGLGKTLLVKTVSKCLSLEFKRIQFTPDLMPADVVGSEVVDEDPSSGRKSFRFAPGPIFSNVVLADEINRTPPKTQAALLEAMEERQVTVSGQTRPLDAPFFVLATQNPIELEGTYPLPEAQLDRFLLNPVIRYLSLEDEIKMVGETTGLERPEPEPVLTGEDILSLQSLTRQLPAPETVVSYAVRLTAASRPEVDSCDEWTRKRVRWGAGSRAAQALILAAKARALLDGRPNASSEDVKVMSKSALRHRILPSFFAESEGIGSDEVIDHLLDSVAA
ncbi:MAG TPA: AAA family ATPase [Opitutae bacterium]|nr:AAA family ATPase [Puniceicoccaceae bacterium]HAU60298.1 AAA family ATPase [Opitutae bacterium]HCY57555.1 AAA family ATPase [Opitutae bacterium]|tara:strand:- start:629 stop:1624 length:996 start_codon:yes stop_codon:yes gene_type:complete